MPSSLTPTSDDNGSRERLCPDWSAVIGMLCRSSHKVDTEGEPIRMQVLLSPPHPPPLLRLNETSESKRNESVIEGDACADKSAASSEAVSGGVVSHLVGSVKMANRENFEDAERGDDTQDGSVSGATTWGYRSNHKEESWHVLGIYLNVLAGILYLLSNLVVFCMYLLPLFVKYSQNNQHSKYYKDSNVM